jgi:hypothetical protein
MGIELGGLFMAMFDYQRLSYWAMNSFLPATPHHLEAIHLDFYSSWRSNMEFQSVTNTRICLRIPYSIYFMMILYISIVYIHIIYIILYIYYITCIYIYVLYIYVLYYILYICTILYIIIYIYHSSNPSSAPAPEPRWQWSAPRWCSRPDQRSQAESGGFSLWSTMAIENGLNILINYSIYV